MPYIEKSRRDILEPVIKETLDWMTYPMETDVAHYLMKMIEGLYFSNEVYKYANDDFKIILDEIKEQLQNIALGDINYLLCTILIRRYDLVANPKYAKIDSAIRDLELLKVCLKQHHSNDLFEFLVGTIQCAEFEIYRRIAVDYENNAIVRNGDIV